jgi:hypothetical protein
MNNTVNVTQNLIVRIVPVNMPNKTNRWGERLGFYQAYVSHTDRNFDIAERETQRGIISELVGYGSGETPQQAATNAIVDYAAKFGPLCLTDSNG